MSAAPADSRGRRWVSPPVSEFVDRLIQAARNLQLPTARKNIATTIQSIRRGERRDALLRTAEDVRTAAWVPDSLRARLVGWLEGRAEGESYGQAPEADLSRYPVLRVADQILETAARGDVNAARGMITQLVAEAARGGAWRGGERALLTQAETFDHAALQSKRHPEAWSEAARLCRVSAAALARSEPPPAAEGEIR